MSHPGDKTLELALDAGPIERIEIELHDCQFRWKLWSGGKLTFVATGAAKASEIDAMAKSTSLITKVTLGTNPHE